MLLKWIACLLIVGSSLIAEQKNVLISGATGGIGKAAVKAFQEKGWKVWAGYRKDIPADLASENIRWVRLDVTDEEIIQAAIEKILKEDSKIDALVNNAGYALVGLEESATIEEVQKQFDVNFYGAMRLLQAVLPAMKNQQSGHIINISSTSGIRALPGMGFYAASKFALEGLSEAIAVTLSPWNIKVSIVEPGIVNNDFINNYYYAQTKDPFQEKFLQNFVAKLNTMVSLGQSCDEIGSLIAEIAENPEPDMRYQTSKKVKELASKKLVDLTGNQMRNDQLRFFNDVLQFVPN